VKYEFKKIEEKWQHYQDVHPLSEMLPDKGKKYYCLDMFPYPSGAGLHMGHWKSYVLSDIFARIKWLEGYNLLHPMGFDAFGLPAENYAIKQSVHPKVSTAANISNFKRQLKQTSCLYNWDKTIDTTDPDYYKWTQWIFIQMFKAGLAYETDFPINWCPSCLTGLANEEVVQGKCERCGTLVTKKNVRQWILKITEYADKLLAGLDKLDWPEKVKTMQRNWIGKSEGAQIIFQTVDKYGKTVELPIFTTRPDTIFGATFIVMAPNHELVDRLVTDITKEEVDNYRELVQSTLAFGSSPEEGKEKTGVFSGAYATNPATGELIPIYLSSYVLVDYGTGIIMAVPAHDERDFEFAVQFDLPRKQVIDAPEVKTDANNDVIHAYMGEGTLVNSGPFNGLDARTEGAQKIIDYLVEKASAIRIINYKMRDWVFSRQRYWGEPIPLIHCPHCGIVAVPEDQLPVLLPDVSNYKPTGTGESPLAAISDWVNTTCPQCSKAAKRETNTMPQWAGSSWYFLRYPNPQLKDKAWDMKDMNYWLPVDLYVGGIEHAILHLLYARFYTKFLYDQGLLSFDEPFTRLFNQGMILKYSEKTGLVEKMSKSLGNIVNPDEIIQQYGTDALRLYILFMGPPELDCEWQDAGLEGTKRFLNRLWDYLTNPHTILQDHETEELAVSKRVNRLLHDYQNRLNHFKPNTAISAFMEFTNDAIAQSMQLSKDSVEKILVSLSIMAPNMTSELLELLLEKPLHACTWPSFDSVILADEDATIVVQVNGKLRANIVVKRGAPKEAVRAAAEEAIAKWIENKTEIKVVFVPDKLINFVVH
jgi:leucyl-tRNA synthetase